MKNYPTASYFNIGQVKHIQVYPRRKECYKAKGAHTQRTKKEQKNKPNKSARWRSAYYCQLILLRFGEGFTREIFDHVLHHITSQLTNICQMQLTKNAHQVVLNTNCAPATRLPLPVCLFEVVFFRKQFIWFLDTEFDRAAWKVTARQLLFLLK